MNIKQASDNTGISREMIRFYEKKGIIHPAREENGYRSYSSHDLLMLVMARQYNCLGIELNTVAELVKENDVQKFRVELSRAAAQLQEEADWLTQKLNYARMLETIFSMAAEGKEYCIFPHEKFCYYPRADFRCFASLYAYNSAIPVLRIQNDNLMKDEYPLEQGMLFMKPVKTDLPVYTYEKGEFFLFVKQNEPNALISRKTLAPMMKIVEQEGYEICGDAFAFMVMGDASENMHDLASFEFEVRKI